MKYKGERRMQILSHSVLCLLTVFTLFPFLLLISASFTDEKAALKYGFSIIPQKVSFAAYQYVLNEWEQIAHAYLVTISVTVIGTLLGMTIVTMLAYALTRNVPGTRVIMFFIIFTMLFNGGIVPTYYIYSNILHIKNTLWALIIPNLLMSAFNVILIKSFFQFNIPNELYESAKLDGANDMVLFQKIALPLSKPILATTGLMTAISYWNDWNNALYYLDNPKYYSIQAILNKINENANYLANNSSTLSTVMHNSTSIPTTTMRMAIALLGILPILIAYPFFQEYFVKGITIGAVKG